MVKKCAFLVLIGLTFSLGWKNRNFKLQTVSNVEILEEINDKTIFQCATYCLTKTKCEAMGVNENKCYLFKNVLSSPGIIMGQVHVLDLIQSKIIKVEVKTANEQGSKTDDVVTGNICGTDGKCCFMANFDIPDHDDFKSGAVDIYEGADLLDCENFHLVGFQSITLTLMGSNGWLGEYFKIYLENGYIYDCKIEDWLDDNEPYLSSAVLDKNTCNYV